MSLWLTIIGMGVITFLIRLYPLAAFNDRLMSPAVQQALSFVPPAVLSAIIFPELLLHGGRLDFSLGNIRLIAGIAAAFVAWRTENVLWTVGSGMLTLWLLQALASL